MCHGNRGEMSQRGRQALTIHPPFLEGFFVCLFFGGKDISACAGFCSGLLLFPFSAGLEDIGKERLADPWHLA